MPSVNCRSGTIFSTRDIATIRLGAKNRPAISTAPASSAIVPAITNGKVVAAVARPPSSKSLHNGVFSFSAPNTRPAAQEPMA
ncbi:hypothetical protein D3C77_645460 [compost metagenome]